MLFFDMTRQEQCFEISLSVQFSNCKLELSPKSLNDSAPVLKYKKVFLNT